MQSCSSQPEQPGPRTPDWLLKIRTEGGRSECSAAVVGNMISIKWRVMAEQRGGRSLIAPTSRWDGLALASSGMSQSGLTSGTTYCCPEESRQPRPTW